MRVTIADAKAAGQYCNRGCRTFLAERGCPVSWREAVLHGVPLDWLESTGDAMAQRVVDYVKAKGSAS